MTLATYFNYNFANLLEWWLTLLQTVNDHLLSVIEFLDDNMTLFYYIADENYDEATMVQQREIENKVHSCYVTLYSVLIVAVCKSKVK